jgi:Cdc6-like AAA superfamily ATPase
MKIGNYSGDIRRVLMITRRAVEIARDKYNSDKKEKKMVQVD